MLPYVLNLYTYFYTNWKSLGDTSKVCMGAKPCAYTNYVCCIIVTNCCYV